MSDPRHRNLELPTRPRKSHMLAKARGELTEGSFVVRVEPKMLGWLLGESRVRGCRMSDILSDCVTGWMNRIAGLYSSGKVFEKPTKRHGKGEGIRVRLLLGVDVLMRVKRLGFEGWEEMESFFLFCLERELEEERVIEDDIDEADEEGDLGVMSWFG